MSGPLIKALLSAGLGEIENENGLKKAASDLNKAFTLIENLAPEDREARIANWLREAASGLHDVTLAATGQDWKSGIPAIDQVALALVMAARESIHLTIYAISTGATSFITALEESVRRRPQLKLWCILDLRQNADQAIVLARLKALAAGNEHRVNLFGFHSERANLHAKILVCDRKTGLLGSANLSTTAFQNSREIGVQITGPVCWELADMVERLSWSGLVEPIL